MLVEKAGKELAKIPFSKGTVGSCVMPVAQPAKPGVCQQVQVCGAAE